MPCRFSIREQFAHNPSEVWALLVDTKRAPEWMKGLVRLEAVDESVHKLGTRLRETRSVKGRESHGESVITGWDPERRYGLTSTERSFEAVYVFDLREADGGAEVTLHAECSAQGLRRAFCPVLIRLMKSHDGDTLARLAAALESR